MAYTDEGKMTFLNVNVPHAGWYNIAWRYTYAAGNFGGITNREMSLIVNGVDLTDHESFPITGSFATNYQYSVFPAHLNAGVNSITLADVSYHGVARLDTLTVSPLTAKVRP
jgi:hypothetical protein